MAIQIAAEPLGRMLSMTEAATLAHPRPSAPRRSVGGAQALPRLHRPRSRSRRIPWLALGAVALLVDLVIAAVLLGGGGPRGGGGLAASTTTTGTLDPLSLLGRTLDRSDCRTAAMAVGDGLAVSCGTWSATTTSSHQATTVTLYAADAEGLPLYRGPMPRSLWWGKGLAAVRSSLGVPFKISRMYGTPTLVYMVDDAPYGALELTFDRYDKLNRIAATLWR